MWVALCTSAPTDSALGTEVSGGSYARVSMTNNTTNWPNATSPGGVGTKSNGVDIVFPPSSGSWGTVTHFMIMDNAAGTASNMIGWGALTTPRTIGASELPKFAASSLVITAD